MKRLSLILITAVSFAPAALAEGCGAGVSHCYKGKTPLANDLFDPTMDCGLDLTKLEECVKSDRSKGVGESFCNDVKLYAGNKQKQVEANMQITESLKTAPKGKKAISEQKETIKMQKQLILGLGDLQAKYTNQFMAAGLTPEQIAKIPPLKRGEAERFKCQKIPGKWLH